MKAITINPELLRNKKIAKEAISKLIKTKQELDDFIDTLELLSDPKFSEELDEGLDEYKKGETIKSSVEELRKETA